MLLMQDAVTVANLSPDALYVALYVDGAYANLAAGKHHCPRAQVLTITVGGLVGFDCCDCETGDLTVTQAIAWVEASLAHGVYRPCVYANASTWDGGLFAALEKYGDSIRRWVAAYPGTGANIPAGYDAHQYATGGVDLSVCLPNFFDAAPKPAPKPAPTSHGTARFEGSVDIATGKVLSLRGIPGVGVHFAGPESYLNLQLQLAVGEHGGDWRSKTLDATDKPL